jgi:magnesium chelatase accessory protein
MNPPSIDRIPKNWPLRELSSSVSIGQMEWHVQIGGSRLTPEGAVKPIALLLHGTGSSAHSWAELLPVLAKTHWVIAPDLPGHGFTISHQSEQLSLTLITHKLAELLRALGVEQIDSIVGHSAGATLGLQYSLLYPAPKRILGLNPSLVSLPSFYHSFLAPLINPIATSSFVSSMIADLLPFTSMIDKLLDSTNSKLNGIQRERYKLLFKQKNHINGSLNFMAKRRVACCDPSLLSTVYRDTKRWWPFVSRGKSGYGISLDSIGNQSGTARFQLIHTKESKTTWTR